MNDFDKINKNRIPGIPIEFVEEKIKNPFESFVGKGIPYLPKDFEIPEIDSAQFYPLIQINFEEIRNGLDILPKKGIYQLWVWPSEEIYRKRPEKRHYKSVYHENLENDLKDFIYPEEIDHLFLLSRGLEKAVLKMKFGKVKEYPPFTEFELGKIGLNKKLLDLDLNKKQWDELFEERYDHHLLGTAELSGTADDARKGDEVNFLQIVSTPPFYIGDEGTFHLFIEKEDLKNKNFLSIRPYGD